MCSGSPYWSWRPPCSSTSATPTLIAFYDGGHGPLSVAPLWLQRGTVPGSGRLHDVLAAPHVSRRRLLKFHAIHHSSEDVDWISAARFHPVNLLLGTIGVDVVLLTRRHLAERDGVARSLSTLIRHARPRQSQLGPRPVQICDRDAGVSPGWHHTTPNVGGNTNFAGTFPDPGTFCLRTFRIARRPAARPIPGVDDQASSRLGTGGHWPIRSGSKVHSIRCCPIRRGGQSA